MGWFFLILGVVLIGLAIHFDNSHECPNCGRELLPEDHHGFHPYNAEEVIEGERIREQVRVMAEAMGARFSPEANALEWLDGRIKELSK